MQKSVHIKTFFYKSLLAAVFSAFIFVQAQPAFICCAYSNHFSLHDNDNGYITYKAGANIGKYKVTSHVYTNVKLNKRYNLVTPHALLPAIALMPVYFTVPSENQRITSHLLRTCLLNCKPLRGPPAVC